MSLFSEGTMSQTLTFGDSCAPITVHAWNKDRTRKKIIIIIIVAAIKLKKN